MVLTCQANIEQELERQWSFLAPSERQKYEYRASLIRREVFEAALSSPALVANTAQSTKPLTHMEKYNLMSGGFWLFFYQYLTNSSTSGVPGRLEHTRFIKKPGC